MTLVVMSQPTQCAYVGGWRGDAALPLDPLPQASPDSRRRGRRDGSSPNSSIGRRDGSSLIAIHASGEGQSTTGFALRGEISTRGDRHPAVRAHRADATLPQIEVKLDAHLNRDRLAEAGAGREDPLSGRLDGLLVQARVERLGDAHVANGAVGQDDHLKMDCPGDLGVKRRGRVLRFTSRRSRGLTMSAPGRKTAPGAGSAAGGGADDGGPGTSRTRRLPSRFDHSVNSRDRVEIVTELNP